MYNKFQSIDSKFQDEKLLKTAINEISIKLGFRLIKLNGMKNAIYKFKFYEKERTKKQSKLY